jgi:hypothetical protein
MASEKETAAEAATSLRALISQIEAGGLTAPPLLIARLEGAVVALEALATGQAPTVDDFLGPEGLHNTVV